MDTRSAHVMHTTITPGLLRLESGDAEEGETDDSTLEVVLGDFSSTFGCWLCREKKCLQDANAGEGGAHHHSFSGHPQLVITFSKHLQERTV